MGNLSWIAAVAGGSLLLLVALAVIWLRRRPARVEPLPTDWALTARPVFSTEERRVHKLLREALPQHVVLAKLPLVRFCQPTEPEDVRYWFDLLGATHVSFAVCTGNGRVLAAIDLENERGNSRRVLQIKQSVLGACRVRYLRTTADTLPSAGELQLLIPSAIARAARPELDEARDSLSSTVANRRAQRSALWPDSSTFQDSFFAPDNRLDAYGHSDLGALPTEPPRLSAVQRSGDGGGGARHGAVASKPPEGDDGGIGAVVTDDDDSVPPQASSSRH